MALARRQTVVRSTPIVLAISVTEMGCPASRSAWTVSINRFSVRRDVLPGEYRYRMLVLLGGGGRDRQFQGSLQLVINMQNQGRNGMIVLPDPSQPQNPSFRLNFKYFQRVEGTFRVPELAKIRSVQVRVLEQGSNQASATQSVDL